MNKGNSGAKTPTLPLLPQRRKHLILSPIPKTWPKALDKEFNNPNILANNPTVRNFLAFSTF